MNYIERAHAFLEDFSKENDFYGLMRVTHRGGIIYEKLLRYCEFRTKAPIEKDNRKVFGL